MLNIRKVKYRVAILLMILLLLAPTVLRCFATGTIILTDPVSQECVLGESGPSLSVTAAATQGGELTYQWFEADGTIVNGATGASFTPVISTGGTHSYYCVVTETLEGAVVATDTSAVADVKVFCDAEKPTITKNPEGVSCQVGQIVTLNVEASVEVGTLSYRWYCYTSESAVGGVTEIYTASSPEFNPPTDKASSVFYFCKVTNTDKDATGEQKVSVNSATALVTVRNPGDAEKPVFYTQPTAVSAFIDNTTALSVGVTVSDGGILSYQWYTCDDATGTNAKKVEGETGPSYIIDTTSEKSFYAFCEVSNYNDSVTGNETATAISNIVSVSVTRPDIPGTVWDGTSSGRFETGEGTANNPYQIATSGQFAYLAEFAAEQSTAGVYFELTEDILLSDGTTEYDWVPVGSIMQPFAGTLNGNGHTVKGMHAQYDVAGLFGCISGATIRNISIEGKVNGKVAGGLAGVAHNSVIENCLVDVSVEGTEKSGSFCGSVCSGVLANCFTTDKVNPVAGEAVGFALTERCYCNSSDASELQTYAELNRGLALWQTAENGQPVLTTNISTGEGDSVYAGTLGMQTGLLTPSGSQDPTAVAQTSVRGILAGSTILLSVNQSDLYCMSKAIGDILKEEPNASVYVYLDGPKVSADGKICSTGISDGELALIENMGMNYDLQFKDGMPDYVQTSAGVCAILTVSYGDIFAIWGDRSELGDSGRSVTASYVQGIDNCLAAVKLGGFAGGTWRVKSDAFNGQTTIAAVCEQSGGTSVVLMGVNSENYAEFVMKDHTCTYSFFTESGIPEQYKNVQTESTAVTIDTASTDITTGPAKDDEKQNVPTAKKGTAVLVAMCLVAISCAGGVIYYQFVSGGFKRKK